jgi:hypothetical protein
VEAGRPADHEAVEQMRDDELALAARDAYYRALIDTVLDRLEQRRLRPDGERAVEGDSGAGAEREERAGGAGGHAWSAGHDTDGEIDELGHDDAGGRSASDLALSSSAAVASE